MDADRAGTFPQDASYEEQLRQHRERIDALDARIVQLLNERQTEALAVRALKRSAGVEPTDAQREEAIVRRLAAESAQTGGLMDERALRAIYAKVFEISKYY